MDFFISEIEIKKIRHLENINILLSYNEKKHLIITGINGSGKTSVLDEICNYFRYQDDIVKNEIKLVISEKNFFRFNNQIGINLLFSNEDDKIELYDQYSKGNFVIAYFPDKRLFNSEVLGMASSVELNPFYKIDDSKPREVFIQYLVNQYIHQLKAESEKDIKKVREIKKWFLHLENILAQLFDDDTIKISCNLNTYDIDINRKNYEPFTFNTLSLGYSAAFDIIANLIMRMIQKNKLTHDVDGIVLIDEPEAHLHVALQKKIMPILVSLFPNIQFIVATHSPFVISSLENAVVFDLQNKLSLTNMTVYSYEGIIEGYFEVDQYSIEVKEKLNRLEALINKPKPTNNEVREMQSLKTYLLSAPDYLSKDLTLKIQDLLLKSRKVL